jgi:O-antigen/teichoic acid export membrane protein
MTERRAFYGAFALGGVNAVRIALQLIVLPVMARLLGPEAFGLIGLAMPFVILANMLSDAGLGAALVRQQNTSKALESTVFWLCAGLGLALSLIICLLAFPLSSLFAHPDLGPILAVLSVILVMSGIVAVPNARISRSRSFGVFAVAEFLAAMISAAVGIAAALSGFGVWSLVIQQVSLWSIKLVWLWWASGFVPALICKPSLAIPHLPFGINAVAANIADFVGKNVPQLIIGGVLGVTNLGYFSIANQLTRAPELVISGPVYLSNFTAVSRLQSDLEAIWTLVLRNLRILTVVLAPIFVGLAVVSDLVVEVVLGPEWLTAAPVLAILSGAGFLLCVSAFFSAVFMGLGKSRHNFVLTLTRGVTISVGVLAGAFFGVSAAAVGVSIGAAVVLPFYLIVLARDLSIDVRPIVAAIGKPFAAAAAMGLSVAALRVLGPHTAAYVDLLMCVALGAGVYALTLAATSGAQLVDDFRNFGPFRLTRA